MNSDDAAAGGTPRIARYKPYYYRLVPGKSYFWCSCGRSENQPFCDGSHEGTGFQPVRYRAEAEAEVLFCGCKHTGAAPFCDGSHNNLRETYAQDDPDSPANRDTPKALHRIDGRLHLNGRCYVARTALLPVNAAANVRWSTVISGATGAEFQSQFHFEIGTGESPGITFGDAETVLLVVAGEARLQIGAQRFALAPETGYYVRPGESFTVHNTNDTPVRFYASVCPKAAEPGFTEVRSAYFDGAYPARSVSFGSAESHRMADRSFQLLVDKRMGAAQLTQFVGHIPLSKAETHRHLYEEALIVLSGEGCMWTEDLRGEVSAGDVIFLPASQPHSLEATHPDGLVVAGVIYPGVNPDINY